MWLSQSGKCFNYLCSVCLSLQPQILQERLLSDLRTKAAADTPSRVPSSVSGFGGVCSGRLLRPAQTGPPRLGTRKTKTHSRGNFPLGCNLELSGPDFPFSINQDPGCCPSNVGKPGCVCGRFCQTARGWRRAQS